jgi:hypothetical protein
VAKFISELYARVTSIKDVAKFCMYKTDDSRILLGLG